MQILIVGAGLAGTTLAYELNKKGASISLLDDAIENSSSKVAAGVIKPITGKRAVKTWNADKLIPEAHSFYNAIQERTGLSFFGSTPLLQLFSSEGNRNDWMGRTIDTKDAHYFSEVVSTNQMPTYIKSSFGGIYLNSCFKLNTRLFLSAIINLLKNDIHSITEKFKWDKLIVKKDHIFYGKIKFDKIIFCEGSKVIENEYFNSIPFAPLKGELIKVQFERTIKQEIISSGIYIIPEYEKIAIVGATYDWADTASAPTSQKRSELVNKLEHIMNLNCRILEQKAAFRPTIQDRRPVVGFHPEFSSIGILNGLGTKGVLLVPYCATQFSDMIMNNIQLDPEIDVKRFSALLEHQGS